MIIAIAGSSHPQLSQRIADKLSVPCIKANIKRFEDQELRIQLEGSFYEKDVAVIQSTAKPANDHLMELLLLVDTARRAGSRRVIAVIPYFGYGRQDRPSYTHGPISASLVATLLEAAGIDRIITVNLHSKQSEGFFKVGVQNLDALPLFAAAYHNKSNCVVVSPDIGGVTRAQQFSGLLNFPLAVIEKKRSPTGEARATAVIGDIAKKECIIVDDIVDTANTLCKAADLLKEQGALAVSACIVHPVLSADAAMLIEQSPIDKLYVSDSIAHTALPHNASIVPIDSLIAEALRPFTQQQ